MAIIATQEKAVNSKPLTKETMKCPTCGELLTNIVKQTYASKSSMWQFLGRVPICKRCVDNIWDEYLEQYSYDVEKAMYYFCMAFDYAFHKKLLESSKKSVEKKGGKVIQRYLTMLNSFGKKNGYASCFKLGEKISIDTLEESIKPRKTRLILSDEDKISKADIIRLLKYDPFTEEPDDIKAFLYSKLIDFLDEDTLNDSFKLPIVIEIVKGFGQAERINRTLSSIDIVNNSNEVDAFKKLTDARANLLRSILSMAKDNGISENYSNSKSKGAGTLSGMIKDLQEKGVHSSDVNLYDIETCEGMRQVADISNKSILDQLMLNENDYVDMIKEQRTLIQELKDKSEKIEEEDRILKVKINEIEQFLKNNKIKFNYNE